MSVHKTFNFSSLKLLFRGSRNQRLIDVQKTLDKDEIVLFDEQEYNEEDKFNSTINNENNTKSTNIINNGLSNLIINLPPKF